MTIAAAILAGGRATRYGGVAKGLLQLPDGTTIIQRLVHVITAAGITEIVICAGDLPRAEGALPVGCAQGEPCAPARTPAPYEHLNLPIIPDAVPNAGPLGGIAAALRHFGKGLGAGGWGLGNGRESHRGAAPASEAGRADGVLILPCDMPAITEREIGALMGAFGEPHPTSSEAPTSSVIAPSPRAERGKGVRFEVDGRSPAPLVVAATGEGEMQPLCAVVSTSLLGEVIQAIEAGELAVGRLWRTVGAELVRFPDAKPFANVNTPEEMAAWVEMRRS